MTKKIHIYELIDDSIDLSQIVEINAIPKEFEKLIKEYIKTDEEEYNLDDFFEFLKKKGYKVAFPQAEKGFYF